MGQLVYGFCVLYVLSVVASLKPSSEEQQLQEVINKAIRAAGGEGNPRAFRAVTCKSKGTYDLGDVRASFRVQFYLQLPGKSRMELKIRIGDTEYEHIRIVSGKQGWVSRPLAEKSIIEMERMTDGELASSEELVYHLHLIYRPETLRDSFLRLSYLGESVIGGRACVGIKVTHPKHREVTIYYDSDTGLLHKLTAHEKHGLSLESVPIDSYFINYKDVDGLRMPFNSKGERNGTLFREWEITEIRFLKEELNSSLFTRPSNVKD